jgi:type I restriction enzyme, S subunit
MKLKTYSEYKNSGSRWLGKVPAHWDVRKLRTLITPRSERNQPELPLLSVAREKGVFVRSLAGDDNNHNVIPEDLSNYKVARKGDLVINKMKAWQGSMGIAPCDGIVSPAYFVYEFQMANQSFGQRLIRSKPYVAHFGQASDGVRIGQWDLSIRGMREIPILVPGDDEQKHIADFLDKVSRRIEKVILAKKKLVALLNEQKQAIIHRAVTRGLDPSVRLKPSGVDWLGDVPEHWELLPFTKCAIEQADYRGATPEKVESGIFLITAKNVRMGWIDYDSSAEFVRADQYGRIMRRGLPKIGDVLLTTEAPLGNVALVDREDVALAQRIIRFRMHQEKLLSEFTLYAMMSHYFQYQLQLRGTGSTAQGIKASKLPQLLILRPPINEQEEIVRDVEARLDKLKSGSTRAHAQINFLREYRMRLISDVVTGKLDVRGVELPSLDDVEEIEMLNSAAAIEGEDLYGAAALDETEEPAYADD